MTETQDKYASLIDLWWPRVVFPAAVVLLVGDVLEQDWFGAGLLTLLAAYAGTRLWRRRRRRPTAV